IRQLPRSWRRRTGLRRPPGTTRPPGPIRSATCHDEIRGASGDVLFHQVLLRRFLHGRGDGLFAERLRFLGIGRRADAGPQQLVERHAVDERLDDEARVGTRAARAVHARPAITVIAPQRRVRRRRPDARRVGRLGFAADRTKRDDAFNALALEPGTCPFGGRGFLARNQSVGGDALNPPPAQLPYELLLAGDPEVLVRTDDQRGNLPAGETHTRRVRSAPRRREARALCPCLDDDHGERRHDRHPESTAAPHGLTVTAAFRVNCSRVSASSFRCSVPWLATIAPVAAPAAAPMAAPVPPPAIPPTIAPSPAPPPTLRAVFLPSPEPLDSTCVVEMSYCRPPNANEFAFSVILSAPFILPACSTLAAWSATADPRGRTTFPSSMTGSSRSDLNIIPLCAASTSIACVR